MAVLKETGLNLQQTLPLEVEIDIARQSKVEAN